MKASLVIAGAALALLAGCGGQARDAFRIGVIVDCSGVGPGAQYERAYAGAELPFARRGAKLRGAQPSGGLGPISIGGRQVELLFSCSAESKLESDLDQARRLVELEGADALVMPPTANAGSAIKRYARKHPEVVFLATGSEQSTTLKQPAPNLFRFQPDAAQLIAGLGTYAYRDLGWRNVVTVGDNDTFGWAQVAGFVAEFCSLGGSVVQRLWAPADTLDYRPLVRRIRSRHVDGVLFDGGLSGGGGSFVFAWAARQPDLAHHLVVGTLSSLLDVGPLGVVGASQVPGASGASQVLGAPLAAPWVRYAADLRRLSGQNAGSLDISYFGATEALLEALQQAHGDVSNGQRPLRAALSRLRLRMPTGIVTLDRRHQAIAPIYLGRLQNQVVPGIHLLRVVRHVEQTFNGYFGPTSPPPSDTQPACRRGNPPAWAR